MLYITLDSVSYSILIEISDICANPATICDFLANRGRPRRSSSHLCVNVSFSPSESVIDIGFVILFLLIAGAPGIIKFPVAPASVIPSFLSILIFDVINAILFYLAQFDVHIVSLLLSILFVGALLFFIVRFLLLVNVVLCYM